LGLIKEGAGIAANVLVMLGIDFRKVRLEVAKIVMAGPDMVSMGKLPQTPRAKKAIEYAIEEARNLHHNYVGTEHLLLGLLREEEGVAAQVLMNLRLKLGDVCQEVLNLLGYTGSPVEGRRLVNTLAAPEPAKPARNPANEIIIIWNVISEGLEEIGQKKEAAIAAMDFEKAAQLRGKEDTFRQRLLDVAKELRDFLRESESNS
jgi:hypothetical protein